MDDSRRRFCQLAGLTIAGVLVPACGDGGTMGDGDMAPRFCNRSASVGVGLNVMDVQPNTATRYMTAQAKLGASIFVCRDEAGIFAIDAGCTHVGTDVELLGVEQGFRCPLHGATFSFTGENPTAPATKPLKHYLVCATESGSLVVDVDQEVDPTFRFKV